MIYTINQNFTFVTIVMTVIVLFSYCQSDFIKEVKIAFGYPSSVPCTAEALVRTTF